MESIMLPKEHDSNLRHHFKQCKNIDIDAVDSCIQEHERENHKTYQPSCVTSTYWALRDDRKNSIIVINQSLVG